MSPSALQENKNSLVVVHLPLFSQLSKFRYNVTLKEIEVGLKRNLNKNLLLRLPDCGWIKRHQSILFTGPTGASHSLPRA